MMKDKNPLKSNFALIEANNTFSEKSQFKCFIGAKIIKARPMTHFEFLRLKGKEIPNHENELGYLVEYPDNYTSWSPKNVFDNAYREIQQSEKDLISNINDI